MNSEPVKARSEPQRDATSSTKSPLTNTITRLFVKVGVLPILVVIAVAIFASASENFLTARNLMNLLRQSSYLVMVSIGQMFVLLTAGFDLSVGTIIALSSVVGASTMASVYAAFPDAVHLAILAGIAAGVGVGLIVGFVNGIGVAHFQVSPFVMTLGISSIGFGIALYLTGGSPVYGMPMAFGDTFGFGNLLGLPTPILFALLMTIVAIIIVNRTRLGRYFYAVGGNINAARLSGINTHKTLILAYLLCASFAAMAGMLITARLDTGEANIGAAMPLESIAACVIAGVSLRGGIGRVEHVVLEAVFISLVQNGMNLTRVESYLQTVVIGALLIFAVIVDQIRIRLLARLGTH
ncbi:ABC transporter permease [Enterovibrio nigricans]|uniref:Monosaccharide ABC transporter membrane protein, CUT2 family n=1 Tax=Enterovibrio nigricans DSM 22720 TaxID=1121868 RepID=A0A1T4V9V4_9GAMM|nr:ABC transporter permease [Enterovibrio nigricans]SKA61718.1 monosaccharide ABC transporter membrane protein, CUT2 family [Enterovibrio nigricans DSM 22720]